MRHYRWLWCGLLCGIALGSGVAQAEPDFVTESRDMVVILQHAVRMDTANPPGDTTELAEYYADGLREVGLEPTLLESEAGQVHVLARIPGDGSARPLLLMNHMDVVAADASEWSHEPFGAEIVAGKLYGRGTLDTKGLGVLQLQVMRLLKRESYRGKRDIIFYAAPDEEAGGGRGAKWMVENHWEDVAAEFVLNEGGSGRKDSFGPGSRVYFVQTAEKGVCWVRVKAEGTSGHGSRPTGDNANVYLVRALQRILAHEPSVRLVPTVARALESLAPVVGGERGELWAQARDTEATPRLVSSLLESKIFNPIVRTTINLTNLKAGYKANVVPSTAEAILDCRILPGETPEDLLALLRKLAHDPTATRQVTFEWIIKGEATESSVESVVYRTIEAVMREADPTAAISPNMSAGGTDSRFWRERGIHAYGFAPFLLTEEQHAGVHGKDEHIDVTNYCAALPLYYEIVRRIADADSAD